LTEEALWFAFRGDQLLLLEGDAVRVPRASAVEEAGIEPTFRRSVGYLDGIPSWAVEMPEDVEAPDGMVFRDLRAIFAVVDEGFWAVAGRAKQLVGWHATNRFCGRCGGVTELVDDELAMRCTRCGMMHHPRVSPAVIVRVRRGDEILLARSPGFPKGMMSILAGFVEPGESIEETIRREVREEVGIEVRNLEYFGSQPWPFPNSLMIGFTADYADGELTPQPGEIEDADWYRTNDLPQMPPRVSIARRMIDAFVEDAGAERS
jgi:NAD+ diphosphatase